MVVDGQISVIRKRGQKAGELYLFAELDVHLFGDALGDGGSGNATRLSIDFCKMVFKR